VTVDRHGRNKRPRGGIPSHERRTLQTTADPRRRRAHRRQRDIVIETPSKVQAEQRAKLINAELAHRIQNTLASVNSICDQTFRAASSLDEARLAFSRRLKPWARRTWC